MKLEHARVRAHRSYAGEYRELSLAAPGIGVAVRPGQFVHLQIPRLEGTALRRPFSVFRADADGIVILYKPVGRGTECMQALKEDDAVSLLGPLGNGFPLDDDAALPVFVAGGYGVAPLSFLAKALGRRGIVFIGGGGAIDILCADDFEALGWDVRIATEDGSLGARGLVTDVLDAWLAESPGKAVVFYACGPDGMLRAVGARALARGAQGWLSLDKRMGCGVGACLACVQRVRRPDGEEAWARVCRDGPIFDAGEIVWQ